MSDTAVTKPIKTAAVLLSESVEKRRQIAEDLAPRIPAIIESLVESARGLWKEKVQTTRKGEQVVHVYQVAPNTKAINTLMRLANYEPEEMSAVLLSTSRVRSIEEDLKAGLSKAKAENLRSQTYLNNKNADAFAASFVVEEDVQGAALAVATACISFIQATPVEVMLRNCESQKTYQQWQMQIAKIIWEAYGEKVGVSDRPAIEAGDDEDSEKEEEAD